MSCDGGTCYAGCTCHEAAWARRLAEAESEASRYWIALEEISDMPHDADGFDATHMQAIADRALLLAPPADGGGGE